MGLRTQGPLRELFLDITGADARPLEKPELDVRWSFANTWNEPMRLGRGSQRASQFLDEQADSLAVRLRAPWPGYPKIWSAVEWKLTGHWGGWSDSPIEGWHSLIGAFNYQRSQFARNEVHLRYSDDGGTAFRIDSPTLAPGDLTLRTQATVLEQGPLALAARLDLKLPIGSLAAAGGSGGFDAGAGVLATWTPSSWATFHGLFAVSRFSGLSAPTLLQPANWHLTAEVSFEAQAGEYTFLVEDRVLSQLLESGWDRVGPRDDDALLSSGLYADFRAHNQISFGIRVGRFTVWLSEDFTPGPNPHSVVNFLWVSNAPDLVMGIAYSLSL
jgi:hypothetical protein